MDKEKTIIFNGIEYRLMGKGTYYLSQSTHNEERRRAKSLHVAIWEYHNGTPVPSRYEIHHKDGDPFNNDIDNLECISRKDHRKIHACKSEKQLKHLEEIRDKAKEWHKSEEGRGWHREHAKESIGNAPQKEHTCIVCGKKFTTRFYNSRFCSRKCESHYRFLDSIHYEKRKCVVCGKEFDAKLSIYNPEGSKTCSRSCSRKLAWARKKEIENAE